MVVFLPFNRNVVSVDTEKVRVETGGLSIYDSSLIIVIHNYPECTKIKEKLTPGF